MKTVQPAIGFYTVSMHMLIHFMIHIYMYITHSFVYIFGKLTDLLKAERKNYSTDYSNCYDQ